MASALTPWTHRLNACAPCAMCLIAMLATMSEAHGSGPFDVLEWADGVTASRNGYAVWVSIASTHHRLQFPNYEREVGSPEHGAVLHVSCRAPGDALPDRFPPIVPYGGIYLDNHPEDAGAYTVLHPMY